MNTEHIIVIPDPILEVQALVGAEGSGERGAGFGGSRELWRERSRLWWERRVLDTRGAGSGGSREFWRVRSRLWWEQSSGY